MQRFSCVSLEIVLRVSRKKLVLEVYNYFMRVVVRIMALLFLFSVLGSLLLLFPIFHKIVLLLVIVIRIIILLTFEELGH